MSPAQKRYNIPSPSSEWQKQLIQDFPSEKEAIIKFFNMADEFPTFKAIFWYVFFKVMPLWFIRLFNPFLVAKKMRNLDKVVKVRIINGHCVINLIESCSTRY